MSHEERNIDAMKYRKSTHLAGVDVEAIIAEKGKCILTIKDAFYAKNVDVSGKKLDGYFLVFAEQGIKDMSVNSTNRKTISANLKTLKNCTSQESRNIGNWIGMSIELFFDENVVMNGKRVGGIRVKPQNPIKEIDTAPLLVKLRACTTKAELQAAWESLTPAEKNNPELLGEKEKLKTTLK